MCAPFFSVYKTFTVPIFFGFPLVNQCVPKQALKMEVGKLPPVHCACTFQPGCVVVEGSLKAALFSRPSVQICRRRWSVESAPIVDSVGEA